MDGISGDGIGRGDGTHGDLHKRDLRRETG